MQTDDQRSDYFNVGAVYSHPGHLAPLGPTRIEIRSGKIVSLDPITNDDSAGEDNNHLVALPALANAHDHGRGLLTPSYDAVDDVLESWIPALSYEPPTDPYLIAVVAFARMVESGICATNHCHNTLNTRILLQEAEAVSRAARDVGIRVAFAVPFFEQNSHVYGNIEEFLKLIPSDDHAKILELEHHLLTMGKETMTLFEQITSFEHDLFHVQYAPVGPQWVSDETLAWISQQSAKTGRRIHMHLLETKWQREWSDARYSDQGLIHHLDKLGLLSPRLTVAHGIYLNEDECRLLAERQVTVSVNTSSNLRLRSGIAPIDLYHHARLPFGLGLDGMSFDDDCDMLKELRLFWHLQRGFGEQQVLTVADLFQAACVIGRKTIANDLGGRLEVGAPADFLILDTRRILQDRIYSSPPKDLLALFLTRMKKEDIVKVIIAGRTIVDRGQCITVDLRKMTERLISLARANPMERVNLDHIDRIRAAVKTFYCCGSHRTKRNTKHD